MDKCADDTDPEFHEAASIVMNTENMRKWWYQSKGEAFLEHMQPWYFSLLQRPVTARLRKTSPEAQDFIDRLCAIGQIAARMALWSDEVPDRTFRQIFEEVGGVMRNLH